MMLNSDFVVLVSIVAMIPDAALHVTCAKEGGGALPCLYECQWITQYGMFFSFGWNILQLARILGDDDEKA